LPETLERQRQELELRSVLGTVFFAVKGQAAPETGRAFARARELWEQLGSPYSRAPACPGGVSRPHRSSRQPVTALVLLDAGCIMTCPAIVPTAELGVIFEMPKQCCSHWTRRWRKPDSNTPGPTEKREAVPRMLTCGSGGTCSPGIEPPPSLSSAGEAMPSKEAGDEQVPILRPRPQSAPLQWSS
jgi:hypothetical protein